MTPMAAGTRLLQAQTKEDDEDPSRQSIDQVIFEQAKAFGKRLQTFETPEQQLQTLQVIFTVPRLKQMIDEAANELEDYKKLKIAFKAGDVAALDAMLLEFPEDMRKKLLDERNQNWVRDLPKLRGDHHTLIAVGAAHFAGPHGLLALLRVAGYTIKSKPE